MQSSAGLRQKRPGVRCVTLTKAILLFVSHIISRGLYAIHSEQPKAFLPHTKVLPCSWSPAFRKIEKRLYSEVMDSSFMHKGEKKNCFQIHVSAYQKPVSVRQCRLWKWQPRLRSDHKTWSRHMIWIPLWSSKSWFYHIFWRLSSRKFFTKISP